MSWKPEGWPTPKWLETKQNTRPVALFYFSFNRGGFEMSLQACRGRFQQILEGYEGPYSCNLQPLNALRKLAEELIETCMTLAQEPPALTVILVFSGTRLYDQQRAAGRHKVLYSYPAIGHWQHLTGVSPLQMLESNNLSENQDRHEITKIRHRALWLPTGVFPRFNEDFCGVI